MSAYVLIEMFTFHSKKIQIQFSANVNTKQIGLGGA